MRGVWRAFVLTVLIIGGAYQGKAKLARSLYPDMELIDNLHLKVRDILETGGNPLNMLEKLKGKCVICDEVGCGVVPVVQKDREWREAVGRLCCELASEADAVIRVTAGLPQYIKNPKGAKGNAYDNERK